MGAALGAECVRARGGHNGFVLGHARLGGRVAKLIWDGRRTCLIRGSEMWTGLELPAVGQGGDVFDAALLRGDVLLVARWSALDGGLFVQL